MIRHLFDYTPLDSNAGSIKESAKKILHWDEKCQKHAEACRRHAQATGKYAVKIGRELESIKNKMPHGLWQHWLESECDYTVRTAQFYMSIAEKFKCATAVAHLGTSVLGFLASDSVPQAARDEAIERSKAGEHISRSKAGRIVDAHSAPLDQSAAAGGEKSRAIAEDAKPAAKPYPNPNPVAINPEAELMNHILRLAKQLSSENAGRVGRAILSLYGQEAASHSVAAAKPAATVARPAQSPLEFDALNIKVPESFEGPRFREAWVAWVQYNAEQGHPLKRLVACKQMEDLTQRSLDAAILAIEKAISDRTKSFPTAKEL